MLAHVTRRTCFEVGYRYSTTYSILALKSKATKLSTVSQSQIRSARNLPSVVPQKPPVGIVQKIWRKLFGKYLLATNVLSSGILMVVGDIAAQEFEYRRGLLKERYDLHRIWRMFVVGSLQGPVHHYAYAWMDRVWPAVNTKNTIKKILIDQIVMAPICIILFFYPACYLENKTLKETNAEVMSKITYIYLADWCVWPGVQYVNFQYLDKKYRVIFVNVVTALYNVFISYIKHDQDGNFLSKFE